MATVKESVEILPGVIVEVNSKAPAEVNEAIENNARRIAIEMTQREAVKKRIIEEARHTLYTLGEQYEAPEEAEELGLLEELKRMALEADMFWTIGKHLINDDDLDGVAEGHGFDF
jgi:hypothetical protein